jgi:integrase
VSTDDILDFMTQITEGRKPQTKRIRFAHLTAFFNFIENNFDFITNNVHNRLMLELMARGGMRVGEVLKLTPNDILDRKLNLNDTKSRKEQELIFIPQNGFTLLH